MSGRRPLAIAGALAIVYVVWGSTYLGIALAIETMPPLLMASARFLIAGGILYAFAAVGRGGLRRPTRAEWLGALLTGTLLLAVGNGGVVYGQQTVPSGVASLLVAAVTLWIVLLDRVAYGRRLGPAAVVGLVVGFAGLAVILGPTGDGGIDPLGAAVLVVSPIGWAAGSLIARRAAVPERTLLGPALQMLAGGAVLAVVGLATGEAGRVDPGAFSARSLGGFAYLVVFGSIVAFTAYVWLLRSARTSLVATYAYVNPVVAVLLGWAVLGEDLGATTLIAGAVVVGAVALIVSGDRLGLPGRRPHAVPRTAEG